MKSHSFINNAHLYLGVTRQELNRRLNSGLVDLELLRSQVEQNSIETELEVVCELKLRKNGLEQVDKFEDSLY